jgi:hypothetical protein
MIIFLLPHHHPSSLFFSFTMSKRMRWARHVARMGLLVGKPEGKRPLGRPRRRWVDNITMYLGEIGWDGVDWIDVAQDREQ